ncbi:hypothetical protein ILUMI_25410 [Ignelater luminosus]|uniref:Zinc finger protein ush n=1 Tax=Ignelater luminosus TaxID=2038154 RepID=A0A8K0C7G0_IGNLU|nr:hypothetical protein ILUMI_25410 [Ignelater luminosus]
MLDAATYIHYSPCKIMLNRYIRGNTKRFLKIHVKGEDEEWGSNDANAMATEEVTAPPGNETTGESDKVSTAGSTVEDERPDKKVIATDEVTTPRLRLKASLATDPALQPQATAVTSVKRDPDAAVSPPNTAEYLASLPPALQTVLASSRFFLPPHINLSESAIRPEPAEVPRQSSAPIFMCAPCSIKFSSLSTLEAHQTYYCSHRINKTSSDAEESKSGTGAEPSGNQSDQDASENASKSVRTGKQYTCTHCSYSADKKVSLNRHMRMHTVSPSPVNPPTTISNGDVGQDNQDRYCADCDIRFSSQKTFRAHKLHYCSSRHMNKPTVTISPAGVPTVVTSSKTTSSCTSGSTSTSPVDTSTCRTPPSPATAATPSQQPFLALPTNPILIVPYSVFRGASLLPGLLPNVSGLPAPDTPCFLLPNGTLQPMSQAVPSNVTSQMEVLKSVNKTKEPPVTRDSSGPLDLSIRKTPEPKELVINLGDDHEKENIKLRSPTPEQIICAPSLHGSPPLTPSSLREPSPVQILSPKRKYEHDSSRSNSPRLSRLTPKVIASETEKSQLSPESNKSLNLSFGIPASLHPLLRAGPLPLLPPELQIRLAAGELPTIPPPTAPQVLVKQGVSKCKECNIVFCKHENYIVHKKHYCSARLQDDEISKNSGSPPVSPGSAGTTSPAGQYQQLICLACGIKFTSLDNLNAHQAYYCLKRNDIEVRRCGKCRGIAEPGHQCVPPGPFAGWKCPCCDVVSATASAAQRHMDTHTGVKAYRCTICRYKGNTLRGMRTHIRMHFDKRSPDLQEEKYISYILEDDGANVVEASMTPSTTGPSNVTDDRAVSPSSEGRAEPLHHCAQCSYSSVYKANVLRHVKLVHNVAEEEHLSNGSTDKNSKSMPTLEEDEEIVVKKEAIEPEVIIAPIEEVTKEEPADVSPEEKSKQESEKEDEALKDESKQRNKYCKSCDISFKFHTTYIAHKKFYCSSHAGEITNANTNNNNPTTRAAEAASVL